MCDVLFYKEDNARFFEVGDRTVFKAPRSSLIIHIMLKSKFCVILFVFSWTKSSVTERIECHWQAETLCGDKCLKVGSGPQCMCGNETITFEETGNYICCHKGTCFEDFNGNINCHGIKQNWRLPCNGTCKQYARYGLTTTSCKDQKQCVKEVLLCRGAPICNE